ncbi:MAG: hypothetical protein KF773_34005 [Deltaproteobacteria bacterium]|nr:hypothetical protein [Deltaproteobacteria bacterium]MCW5801241.1 hypothetical protein [Deltaproteobacteria bacterium]
MRAAAVVVTLTCLATGCFPNNARHRTYAKFGEGAALVGGIAMLAASSTGADCSPQLGRPGVIECRDSATMVGNVGLGLILVGLVGFLATVSTAPDDDAKTKTGPLPTASAPAPTPIAVPALPGAKPST